MASNGLTGAIYAGGQKVDYVAVAAAESALLILTLGRRSRTAARTARSARLGGAAAAMLRKPVARVNSIAHLHPQESKWI